MPSALTTTAVAAAMPGGVLPRVGNDAIVRTSSGRYASRPMCTSWPRCAAGFCPRIDDASGRLPLRAAPPLASMALADQAAATPAAVARALSPLRRRVGPFCLPKVCLRRQMLL